MYVCDYIAYNLKFKVMMREESKRGPTASLESKKEKESQGKGRAKSQILLFHYLRLLLTFLFHTVKSTGSHTIS